MIVKLLSGFDVEVRVRLVPTQGTLPYEYIVECVCDDGVITSYTNPNMHDAMLQCFCAFIQLQGLGAQEIYEMCDELRAIRTAIGFKPVV